MWYLIDLAIIVACVVLFLFLVGLTKFKYKGACTTIAIWFITCLFITVAFFFGHIITIGISDVLKISHSNANLFAIIPHELSYMILGAVIVWLWKELRQ